PGNSKSRRVGFRARDPVAKGPAHPSSGRAGKRPRLTPNPAVVAREGRPFMPVGWPGGDAQTQAEVQALPNIMDFDMQVQAAIEAPRIVSWNFPNSFAPHA